MTAKGHFTAYLARKAEAERVKAAVRDFLAAFDAETGGTFADERARRKAFAQRLFGPEASPELKALAGYCFHAYDGHDAKLDATLLRKVILSS